MKFTMLPKPWPKVIAEVEAGGHSYTESLEDAEFLVFSGGPDEFPSTLPEGIEFVQYTFAGVEHLIEAGVLDDSVRWTNAGGVYGKPVAEVALGLIIGQMHLFKIPARNDDFARREISHRQNWLFNGKRVLLIGGGGIARELITLLKPFDVTTTVLNRSGNPVEGAGQVRTIEHLHDELPKADVVVLTTPLTEQTRHMISTQELELMPEDSLLVNVGRGPLVDTDALVQALNSGSIGGAAMDVTDPEPLPQGHPLWAMDNVLISPHIAAPANIAKELIGPVIVSNADACARGERMPTEVDAQAGY
ncbi:D-isomer specific 2-hydroxyacid dehydrogenase family protein [Corynebacterium tapiri]|uniref:D-isomer specific 2-hydroxyacid dehydrogenase NAD-binding domain-containing protein n=1 Tax=Corynebacterium tapiri TaxID=1448266 RepID=A0A5C4U423_9CORY|nr:D-isomer specific 2-hydroxyacid dehydrogenase family protein [Corynebacterium tapiri]TNL96633.1 hypothetical protein FHE74_08015 [Corynebacterium tapiri]